MLNKPYERIHSEGNVNYYLLRTDKEAFITIENFIPTDVGEELTISVSQFPVVAGILGVLGMFAEVKVVNEVKDEDGEALETIYEILDITKLRKTMADGIIELERSLAGYHSKYDYETNPRSEIIKTFKYDGKYQTLMIEELNTRVRNTWLAKSTPTGVLVLHSLVTTGAVLKHEHLTMMSTFLLSIETAKAIVAFLKAEYAKANEPKIETEKEGE